MFFSRSIRRKLSGGLFIVALMIVVLTLSGLNGLYSYRQSVSEFKFAINEAPRRSELLSTIAHLAEPLNVEVTEDQTSWFGQKKAFSIQLEIAKQKLTKLQKKLDILPNTTSYSLVRVRMNRTLATMRDEIREMEAVHAGLDSPAQRDETIAFLRKQTFDLLNVAGEFPEHQENLENTLKEATEVYNAGFWWVGCTALVVLGMFLYLTIRLNLGVVIPLRKLRQGASRIANGDTGHRVEVETQDEMGELAKSFNQMADKFQDMVKDREQEIDARCKQLVRSERLANIGLLAAGVAHEINNPLSAVSMASESITDRLAYFNPTPEQKEDIEAAQHYLTMICRESKRCQDITHKLLEFARGQDEERKRTDIVALINEVLEMVFHMSQYRDRELKFDRATPCFAVVNGPEIKQVIINIVSNALQAMDPDGKLWIELDEKSEELLLTFRDDGHGMAQETIDHLFEPFYTNRKDGKGTGLGMSISNRIISDHGGSLNAESPGVGQGSVFHIRLPKRLTQQLKRAA
ncbi:Sporulation kinase D [Polystyrenella longa]|uniref:histidine kinase n=1 Tax=Polystyrenella longa TaxID=2528007 RepID=A0A518CKW0_9PLAN|nr:HAMP domain-containing sensor histidine kinase [Polystyrenella longa]QDU79859.1 Sporulation kinase D [Polystyrenella longa]